MREPGGYEVAIRKAVSVFGEEVKPKLKGSTGTEDQLRAPFERLATAAAGALGLKSTLIGEVPLVDIGVRPDYAVHIADALVGHVELKRPGVGADPETFTGRNARQWQKLKLLPNVLYSDGNQWGLYRNGQRVGELARTNLSVRTAGHKLAPADAGISKVIFDFLTWKPQPPRNITQLVHAVAGLCKLLCTEVKEALALEKAGKRLETFTVLKEDWGKLLFPNQSNEEFADQYAQTVVFALLLARVEGIAFENETMHGIANKLGKKHSLMGKALDVLTDDSLTGLSTTLDTLIRVIGAVDWEVLDDGSGDAYLRLYEDFLQVYDPKLRERTGSYYTPNGVVAAMVRFTEDVLRQRLGISDGFSSPQVVTVDPAMGTGTFLLNILERAAQSITEDEGPGSVAPRLREMTGERLIGFEMQTGPYAVAELRMHARLKDLKSEAPAQGLRLYVTNTLDNPKDEFKWLPGTFKAIAESRQKANRVKREERVMVVLGNPPYDAVSKGAGKWIELGDPDEGVPAPLNRFRLPGNGKYESKMSNLYVYFWNWATWKVFDCHDDAQYGVITFITPRAWIKGVGFAGMRKYLRSVADEGWIIDLSPEGQRSDGSTRIFPEVAQELCIAVFVRWQRPDDTDTPKPPAVVRHLALGGHRDQKIEQLTSITINDSRWRTCASGDTDLFLPPGSDLWESSPRLSDLMPWSSRGVTPGRRWVYAPDRATLVRRWQLFLAADEEEKLEMFLRADQRGKPQDRELHSLVDSLPGVEERGRVTLAEETRGVVEPVRVGYRAFDRQWMIPDNRLTVRPRRDLWRVRSDEQLFVVEQNAHAVRGGPGLVFSSVIPDMDYYNGRSGAVRPLYRTTGRDAPNVTPKLLQVVAQRLNTSVTAEDLVAYIAAITSHPAYTDRFKEDLEVPGARVPITADLTLWTRAVELGRNVLWLHTYGERFADPSAGRPAPPKRPRMPEGRRPVSQEAIPDTVEGMPADLRFDAESKKLWIGAGCIAPVEPQVFAYSVSGWNVLDRWFKYRRKDPAGKRQLPLDEEYARTWLPDWTSELLDLLNVLGLLVELEPQQRDLLDEVCQGRRITRDDLTSAGVLPVPKYATSLPKQGEEGAIF
ncbi:DNA methyltransferase [Streptomyces sp. NTH33]|uniref:type ISP restriction/modification enzyme n=1 Tax=Streptomyces sp. NTH33 TaxID=1735453 RepID=UPI000DA9E09B|nr:type ISP restriction/modification enzyme [Streptomyces sp. NTH33]PZH02714.1 DNA methyltransferase [Streptomyces sp. NTH33]